VSCGLKMKNLRPKNHMKWQEWGERNSLLYLYTRVARFFLIQRY
jgi:hypothetical protein